MNLRKTGRALAAVATAGIAVLALSGCAGKPGAAAVKDGTVVTEDELSTVSRELADVSPQLDREITLRLLMMYKKGGSDILENGKCPDAKQLPIAFPQVKDLDKLSDQTKGTLELFTCLALMDPQQQMTAESLGMTVPDTKTTADLLKLETGELMKDSGWKVSPRYPRALLDLNGTQAQG